MKKILIVLTLILITNPMFAGKRNIVSETPEKAYRSFRLANRELRELGFTIEHVKENIEFIASLKIRDKFYQVQVNHYKKKIKIDIYCFNSVKKKWSSKNFGENVMIDIHNAIRFRVEHNTTIPPISLPGLWGNVIRNKNVK